MIYTFLTQADIEAAIKPQYLVQLLADQPENHLSRNEAAATSFVKAYLANRYDNAQVFRTIKVFAPAKAYTGPGTDGAFTQWVYYNEVFYAAKAAVPGTAAVDAPDAETMVPDYADSEFWEENDPRDANLIHQITNITVFYLYRHINPVKIPTFWVELYNQAKDWLVDVKKADITPDLPRIIEETSDNIQWGSNPKIEHLY